MPATTTDTTDTDQPPTVDQEAANVAFAQEARALALGNPRRNGTVGGYEADSSEVDW